MEYGKVHSGKNGTRYYVAKGGETVADVSSATGVAKDTIKKQNPAVEYGKALARGAIVMLNLGENQETKSKFSGVINLASTLKEKAEEIKDAKEKDTKTSKISNTSEKKKNIAEKLKEYSDKIKNAEYDYEFNTDVAQRKYSDSINKLKDTLKSRYSGIKTDMASQKISQSSIAENERNKAQKEFNTSSNEKTNELNEKLSALKTKKDRTVATQKEKIKNLNAT